MHARKSSASLCTLRWLRAWRASPERCVSFAATTVCGAVNDRVFSLFSVIDRYEKRKKKKRKKSKKKRKKRNMRR